MKRFAFIATIAIALVVALGFSACTATVTVGGNNNNTPTGISGTIVNDHWTTNTYVSGDVTVTGSLVIDPGVTVTVASDVYISIASAAAFSAVGTAALPIVFKSTGASVVWRYIYIDDGAGTQAAPITMKYCTVTGAGYLAYPAIQIGANYFTAVADIENCTIYGNGGQGINADRAGPHTVIKGNKFYSNADFAMVANDDVAFDNSNTFAAMGTTVDLTNIKNSVVFHGPIITARAFDITEVPYYFDTDVTVQSGSLTISPSVTILFGQNVYLAVNAGTTFTANGLTSATPIVFKPASASVTWKQIYFDDGATVNTMKFCTVSGAGYNYEYAIHIGANYYTSAADIEYCTISGNANGGIDATHAVSGTKIEYCSFVNNNATGSGGVGVYDIYSNGNAGVNTFGSTGNFY